MNKVMNIEQAEKLLTGDSALTDTQRAEVVTVTSTAMQEAAVALSGQVGKVDGLEACVKHTIITFFHSQPTCGQLAHALRTTLTEAYPHEEISQKGTPAKYKAFKYFRDTLRKEGKLVAESTGLTGYNVKVDRDRSKNGTNDYLISVGPFTGDMLAAETAKKAADKKAAETEATEAKELLKEAMVAETARTPITMLAQQLRDYAAETFKGADMVALATAFQAAVNEDVAKAGSVKPAQPVKAS